MRTIPHGRRNKEAKMRTLILTGGGSAGHVVPNLALMKALAPSFRIGYLGTGGMEEALVRECTSLRECDVPPDVKEFGEAVFRGCTCLQSVDMPSVLRMTEGAFYGCAALQRLNVSPLLEGAEENSFLTCPLLDAVVSGMHFCIGKKGRVVKL